MVEDNAIFQEKVKNSFIKVKEEINSLKIELEKIKSLIKDFLSENKPILEKIGQKAGNLTKKSENLTISKKVPQEIIGSILTNNKQTTNKQQTNNKQTLNTHLTTKQQFNTQDDGEYDFLYDLTKKELLVYLTILEIQDEEGLRPTYSSLSQRLKIPYGALRLKMMELIRKEVPLQRSMINNQIAVFTIPEKFLNPHFKQKITDIYYSKDYAHLGL